MTTPERLRRRQRRESAGIALLAVGLVASVIYFAGQDNAQDACLRDIISEQNRTSKIRSGLVERESKATRSIISSALTAKSKEDVIAARETYFNKLAEIDQLRAENPVTTIPSGICG